MTDTRTVSRGLRLVQELREQMPSTQVVALAAAKPPGLVQQVLAAEVLGVVDKHTSADRLLHASPRPVPPTRSLPGWAA
jgi:two-component system response regulator DesR